MRRPAHGATARPGPRAPGNGYGRSIGRPGPRVPITAARPLEPARFVVVEPVAGPQGHLPLDPAVTP
jgi:hypothetical protein